MVNDSLFGYWIIGDSGRLRGQPFEFFAFLRDAEKRQLGVYQQVSVQLFGCK